MLAEVGFGVILCNMFLTETDFILMAYVVCRQPVTKEVITQVKKLYFSTIFKAQAHCSRPERNHVVSAWPKYLTVFKSKFNKKVSTISCLLAFLFPL